MLKEKGKKMEQKKTGMDVFLLIIILLLTLLLLYTLWESKEHERKLWQYYNNELARQGCNEPIQIPDWMSSNMTANWDYYGGIKNESNIQSPNS